MTEAEWLACNVPIGLLAELRAWVESPKRKWRLFALACFEPWRVRLPHRERLSSVLDVLARDAEGKCPPDELCRAQKLAADTVRLVTDDASEQRWYYFGEVLAEAVQEATENSWERHAPYVAAKCRDAAGYHATGERESVASQREEERQAASIRDIFGNPFRPVSLDPSWLTFDVQTLARGIYDEKAFDRMPILADALQDAGCGSADVLTHCRGEEPHVRGCWVLDLLLEKS